MATTFQNVTDANRTPPASSKATLNRMRAVRRFNTKPELELRSLLHCLGLRYRVDYPPLSSVTRRADIVFTRLRIAVFVDGCFWHGCPLHGTRPKTNGDWWEAKIKANRERDEDTNRRLRQEGWTVLRFWEHQDAESSALNVFRVVNRRRKVL